MSMIDPWRNVRPPRVPIPIGPTIALIAMLGAVGVVLLLQQTALPRPPITSAESLGMAEASFKDADYQRAAHLFTNLANKNDPTAQYWLGHMTELGLGVKRDPAKAIELYRKATAGNITAADLRLGEIYLDGNLVPPDFVRAKTYLTRAADRGNAEAAMLLGKMYDRGLGTAVNPKKAYAWLEVSAIEGNSAARRARNQSLYSLNAVDQRAALTLAQEVLDSIEHDTTSVSVAGPTRSQAGTGLSFERSKTEKPVS